MHESATYPAVVQNGQGVDHRLITPSQLSLFSRSPRIKAWWEELKTRGLFSGVQPPPSALDEQLFKDGLRHEQVLLDLLEAEGYRIAQVVEALLGSSYRHASGSGERCGVLTPDDILVTAPYNVQVNRLQHLLGHRARVGTVDKFQGQEAPVAIHSLTASDGDAAPRGLSFLLEPNRLNVAISRARCLSIVVGSPSLMTGIANSVEEAEQINRLCRITQE
jgi:hypothetical protein